MSITDVLVGDRVRWTSNEGIKRGEVVNIFPAEDMFGNNNDYYHIEYSDGFGGITKCFICQDQAEELQFKVIFRDIGIMDILSLMHHIAEAEAIPTAATYHYMALRMAGILQTLLAEGCVEVKDCVDFLTEKYNYKEL